MRDKRLATAVATLLAAFATAHLMQFGLSAGRLIAGDGQATPIGLATLVARPSGEGPVVLPEGPESLPAAAALAAALPTPDARALPRDARLPEAVERPRGNALGLTCDRRLEVRAGPDASLRAEVTAPCDPGVRVEIAHAGLRFAIGTGSDGRALAEIPAMMPDSVVTARFLDGTVLRAEAAMPEAAGLDRVAVVAEGWTGLTLHTLTAPRGMSGRAQAGGRRAGEIVRLGDAQLDAPLIAEVYTLPSGRFGALGHVRLELEAVVTQANCGRDISADLVRSGGLAGPVRLGLSVPSCEAVGEMLVLPLPVTDLRLAGK